MSATMLILMLLSGQTAAQLQNDSHRPAPEPNPAGDQLMNPTAQDMIRTGTLAHGATLDRNAVRNGGKRNAVPAKAADIVVGRAVSDSRGIAVGSVAAVDADGAVVRTAAGAARVPLNAFGMDGPGLVIGITKAQFDALVAKANALPG